MDGDVRWRTPDALTVSHRVIGDTVVVRVVGQLTVDNRESLLSKFVKARLAEGSRSFVVNLGEVPSCDTRGLAELVVSLTSVEQHDGALKLAHVQPRVVTLLETTGLLSVFDVFDTEREAVGSFRRSG